MQLGEDFLHFLKERPDVQLLGADGFALSAANTGRGVILKGSILTGSAFFLLQVGIHSCKYVGNGNARRAAVYTIAAGGTGNPVLSLI